ncbi:unnamed protein product, partial [marine sediment metagenome]
KDSIPSEPVPENRSKTFDPAILSPITLKILSFTLSKVGLIL